MKNCFLFCCLFFAANLFGQQPFVVKTDNKPVDFRETQRQFNDWKKGKDLGKTRHWKHFKRWEYEMQLHTGGNGEPGDPSGYFEAAAEMARYKEQQQQSRSMMANWYPVGPNVLPNNLTGYMENGVGRINCMAFDPISTSTFYVGVAQGGLWKTTNNGLNWTPLTDNLPITRISDIAIDPTNTNTMYVSVCDFEYIGFGLFLNGRKRHTHYGVGVYKTTDGGTTWNPTGLSFQLTDGDASLIRKIVINPVNTSQLVACGVSGMYRSTDGGTNWTQLMDTLFWDMVQDPTAPSTLYAASGWVLNSNMGYAAIYKSTDFGATWTLLNTGIPTTGTVQRIKLAIAPSNTNTVYALAVDNQSGCYRFYKTINGGTNWTTINPNVNVLDGNNGQGSGGQGTYDIGLLIDETDANKVFVGGVNMWLSTNGASTFNPVAHWTTNYGPTLHGDIHYIDRQPQTGNVFVCSDGGIYRANNAIQSITWNQANNGNFWPTQWTKLNDNLQITSFYRISSSKSSQAELIGGAQDNASFYFDGTSWYTIFGGDGMDNAMYVNTPGSAIGSSQYGNFYLTFDGGINSFNANANVGNENAEWVSPIIMDYNNSGTVYAGFENVTKSTDGGNSWSSISNFPTGFYGTEVVAIAVANSNANVIYAGKRVRYEYNEPGVMYKTINGGSSWTDITAGLPDSLYYTGIEIDETNADIVYVTMAGFVSGQKVFRSVDGGTTWQNISYNLPNLPVNCIKGIPSSGGDLLIGTDIGVYKLDYNANTWVNQSMGLPNVIISDIEFNVPANKIYVSTFGRGIWANDLSVFTSASTAATTDSGLKLYPSVNNGSFTIEINEQLKDKTLQLEIIDVMGRVVVKEQLQGRARYDEQLQVGAGMYYARLSGSGVSAVKSFIVK